MDERLFRAKDNRKWMKTTHTETEKTRYLNINRGAFFMFPSPHFRKWVVFKLSVDYSNNQIHRRKLKKVPELTTEVSKIYEQFSQSTNFVKRGEGESTSSTPTRSSRF